MARSRLETFSLIASIVGVPIALVALIVQWPSPVKPALPAIQVAAPQNVVEPSQEAKVLPESSIASSLEAARRLSSSTERYTEYERLAALAIQRREFGAAIQAAKGIGSSARRAKVADGIHCYAVHFGEWAIASEAVKLAGSSKARDQMHLRASQMRSVRPGEGYNDAQCAPI
jgi:hypothetical protein